MNNKWNSFLRDPMPSVSWTLYESFLNVSAYIGAIRLFVSSIFWNIRIDFPYKAIGPVLFKKYPMSTIHIGRNSFFRSSYHSNLVGINRPCSISTHSKKAKIIIGKHCGFSGTIVGGYDEIIIGDNVLCGANTTITDFDWHFIQQNGIEVMNSAPVLIHNNVWIGMNTVVLKGVEIGENSIIGANSVVTNSVPHNVLAAGNPAKIIRQL